MKKRLIFPHIILLFLIICTESGFGQKIPVDADTTRRSAVKIFLDCYECDMNYIRQEIPYINYVRDVHEAQVYILETKQDAGSGGEQFTFTFQGQGEFKGMNDTLIFTSSPDQTNTIIREKRMRLLTIQDSKRKR
jgi:hypothetical protein